MAPSLTGLISGSIDVDELVQDSFAITGVGLECALLISGSILNVIDSWTDFVDDSNRVGPVRSNKLFSGSMCAGEVVFVGFSSTSFSGSTLDVIDSSTDSIKSFDGVGLERSLGFLTSGSMFVEDDFVWFSSTFFSGSTLDVIDSWTDFVKDSNWVGPVRSNRLFSGSMCADEVDFVGFSSTFFSGSTWDVGNSSIDSFKDLDWVGLERSLGFLTSGSMFVEDNFVWFSSTFFSGSSSDVIDSWTDFVEDSNWVGPVRSNRLTSGSMCADEVDFDWFSSIFFSWSTLDVIDSSIDSVKDFDWIGLERSLDFLTSGSMFVEDGFVGFSSTFFSGSTFDVGNSSVGLELSLAVLTPGSISDDGVNFPLKSAQDSNWMHLEESETVSFTPDLSSGSKLNEIDSLFGSAKDFNGGLDRSNMLPLPIVLTSGSIVANDVDSWIGSGKDSNGLGLGRSKTLSLGAFWISGLTIAGASDVVKDLNSAELGEFSHSFFLSGFILGSTGPEIIASLTKDSSLSIFEDLLTSRIVVQRAPVLFSSSLAGSEAGKESEIIPSSKILELSILSFAVMPAGSTTLEEDLENWGSDPSWALSTEFVWLDGLETGTTRQTTRSRILQPRAAGSLSVSLVSSATSAGSVSHFACSSIVKASAFAGGGSQRVPISSADPEWSIFGMKTESTKFWDMVIEFNSVGYFMETAGTVESSGSARTEFVLKDEWPFLGAIRSWFVEEAGGAVSNESLGKISFKFSWASDPESGFGQTVKRISWRGSSSIFKSGNLGVSGALVCGSMELMTLSSWINLTLTSRWELEELIESFAIELGALLSGISGSSDRSISSRSFDSSVNSGVESLPDSAWFWSWSWSWLPSRSFR